MEMGKIKFAISQGAAEEISEKLEIALAPVPLTLEERVSLLEGRKIWFSKTGLNAEAVTAIVAPEAHPYAYTVLYSLPLADLAVGDLIHAEAQFEVTNTEANSRYMVGRWLTLADSPQGTTGPRLCQPAGLNVEYPRHHETLVVTGDFIVNAPLTGKYLNLVVYSQRLGLGGTGSLKVEQNYGHLSVTVTPAAMLA